MVAELLDGLPDGAVLDLRVGAFWTAVVTELDGQRRCGLASNLREVAHHHSHGPAVQAAGRLTESSARQLTRLSSSKSVIEAAVGLAALNALLPRLEDRWVECNAEEVIAHHGSGKRVALVGHFPFVDRLRERVGSLRVLEQHPQAGDLPAEAAAKELPRAEVVAITGTTLLNHTFEPLMALRNPEALVLMLGPSTPLSPIMFRHGVDLLSGSAVDDIDAVLRAVSQGANFRQVHHYGVRLVTMMREAAMGLGYLRR